MMRTCAAAGVHGIIGARTMPCIVMLVPAMQWMPGCSTPHRRVLTRVESTSTRCAPRWTPLSGRCIVGLHAGRLARSAVSALEGAHPHADVRSPWRRPRFATRSIAG